MSTVGGPNIVQTGLEIALDSGGRGYPGEGSAWLNLVDQTVFNGSNYATAGWANNINNITLFTVIEKVGTGTGYANHPFNKWNSGTGNSSFVLYHFQNYQGNGADGQFSWYFTTANNGWSGYGVGKINVGDFIMTCFEYDSTTGLQVWRDGTVLGGRTGHRGTLGTGGSGAINIDGPTGGGITKVHTALMYSRSLTNEEISQNFNALQNRFGL